MNDESTEGDPIGEVGVLRERVRLLTEELGWRNGDLADSEHEVTVLNAEIGVLNAQKEILEAALEERNDEIERFRLRMEGKEQVIYELQRDLRDSEDLVAERDEYVSSLQRQLNDAEDAVDLVRRERMTVSTEARRVTQLGFQVFAQQVKELLKGLATEDLARTCGIGLQAAAAERVRLQEVVSKGMSTVIPKGDGPVQYRVGPWQEEMLREYSDLVLAAVESKVLDRWYRNGADDDLLRDWNAIRTSLGFQRREPDTARAIALLRPTVHTMGPRTSEVER